MGKHRFSVTVLRPAVFLRMYGSLYALIALSSFYLRQVMVPVVVVVDVVVVVVVGEMYFLRTKTTL